MHGDAENKAYKIYVLALNLYRYLHKNRKKNDI